MYVHTYIYILSLWHVLYVWQSRKESRWEYVNVKFLPHHECFVHGVPQLEGVVTDGQVVLQSERLQHNAISHWESQTQVITGVTLNGKQSWLLGRFHWGDKNFSWRTKELHLHFDQSNGNYI